MGSYLAVVFTDLERHSLVWSRTPRDKMVAIIAEYRYLAESMAGQYGCLHLNFTGDGHLFLYESADAAVRFGLRLIAAWGRSGESLAALEGLSHMPLRAGCHFGECMQLDGDEWIGRAINLAKRIEDSAEGDSLLVTESVLELVDVPLYRFEEAGRHALKGDHLPQRALYRVTALEDSTLASRPQENLSAEDWFLEALSLVGSGKENSQEEEKRYAQALRLRQDYPEAHNNLAIMLRTRGDHAGAAEHYREALRLRPDYPEAHYNYAILLELRGSTAGAAEHYREALRLRPDYVDGHHGYANLLKSKGELAEARTHYEAALRVRPAYAEAHNNYAILLEDLGDSEQARAHYSEALRLRPDYAEAHYNTAIFLENLGDPGAARNHYGEALRSRPEYPEAHNNLAVLLHIKGELDSAEKHYREALRLRPEDPEAHYNFALLLKAKGDAGAAEEHRRMALELAPESPAFQSAIEPPN